MLLGTLMITIHNPCFSHTTRGFSFAFSKAPWPLSPDNPISQMQFCFHSRFALPVPPADLPIPDAKRKALDPGWMQVWYSLTCRWHVRYLWGACVLDWKLAKTKSLGRNGLLVTDRQERAETNEGWLMVLSRSSGVEICTHSPGTSEVAGPWEGGVYLNEKGIWNLGREYLGEESCTHRVFNYLSLCQMLVWVKWAWSGNELTKSTGILRADQMQHQENCALFSQTRLQGWTKWCDRTQHVSRHFWRRTTTTKMVKQEIAFIKTIAITTWWEIGLQGRQWELFLSKDPLLWILVFLYKSFPLGLGFYFQTPIQGFTDWTHRLLVLKRSLEIT